MYGAAFTHRARGGFGERECGAAFRKARQRRCNVVDHVREMVELGAIGRIIAFGKGVGNAIGTHPRLGGEPHRGARDVVNAERAAAAESLDPLVIAIAGARSEEHTSELQSLMRISYAVFCLKKKIKKTILEATDTQV